VLLCALLAACGGGSSSSSSSAGSRVAPALVAALEAAAQTKAPWRCAAADGAEASAETLTVGKRAWKVGGHAMELDGEGAIDIGVIADAGGSVAALGRLRDAIGGVDLMIALGGMGATQAEIEAVLTALAPDKAAVLAIPGDLEPAQAHGAAVAALRAKRLPVVDARLVHRVAVPGADLAILAGAGSELRLAAGADGCGYREHDAKVAFADLAKAAGLRILVSPEGPRRVVEGDATGELALVPPADSVDLVLHGPAADAPVSPARNGKRDGEGVALTPGTSDAGPRLPVHRPATAGILSISGKGWAWRPIGDAP
jgi:hypothetical protein